MFISFKVGIRVKKGIDRADTFQVLLICNARNLTRFILSRHHAFDGVKTICHVDAQIPFLVE